MYLVSEALVGDGNEVAHLDLIIGEKEGPVGTAFAVALSNPTIGHTPLLSVLIPNLMSKPATIMIPKVDMKNMPQVVLMFGPAQAAISQAIADSIREKIIPENICEEICIICGVFIHPAAKDEKKIYENNFEAMKIAIKNGFAKLPTAQETVAKKDSVKHPFRGF